MKREASYESHAAAAKAFLRDGAKAKWHDDTLWFIRSKRDTASKKLTEWEALREAASNIKDHTLSNLDLYLEQFERRAKANGVHVHWAINAEEHNKIVCRLLRLHNAERVVKSKSMLTEECHLNEYLQGQDIDVVDTDLGERIIQLKGEKPSHIVLPAIHLRKEEVSDVFHEHLGTEKANADPHYLTGAARNHLRQKFFAADAAITGVNFAVAETGQIVLCTNEGNADLAVHLAPLHIASMGIEKMIPKQEHLAVFLRLLARSATGQPITTYSSHFEKPKSGQAFHIIIVDNGRTRHLAQADFRASLKCIRCAACFNTCPIYRRSGGHSYRSTVAGPIGSILSPSIDKKQFADLPFASTLCGSCSNVCPVKINIHEQLWLWRQAITKEGYAPKAKSIAMKLMAIVLARPRLYKVSGKLGRFALRHASFLLKNKTLNPWTRGRALPSAPKASFRDWYKNQTNA